MTLQASSGWAVAELEAQFLSSDFKFTAHFPARVVLCWQLGLSDIDNFINDGNVLSQTVIKR